jgi:hypothetical protein
MWMIWVQIPKWVWWSPDSFLKNFRILWGLKVGSWQILLRIWGSSRIFGEFSGNCFFFLFCFWVVWEIVLYEEGLNEKPTNVHQEKFEFIIWYNIISDFDQGTKAWPRNSDRREFSFWSFSSISSPFKDFNYTINGNCNFQTVNNWLNKEPFSSTICTFVQKITSDKHFWCFCMKVVSRTDHIVEEEEEFHI